MRIYDARKLCPAHPAAGAPEGLCRGFDAHQARACATQPRRRGVQRGRGVHRCHPLPAPARQPRNTWGGWRALPSRSQWRPAVLHRHRQQVHRQDRFGIQEADGFTVVPPAEARRWLQEVPMQKLCGLGPAIAEFLSRHGARTCGDVAALPLSILERRFGVTGKYLGSPAKARIRSRCVVTSPRPSPSATTKVLPPRTTSRQVVETYLRHMCERWRRGCGATACRPGGCMWGCAAPNSATASAKRTRCLRGAGRPAIFDHARRVSEGALAR